jgi:hypothetical protein
VALGDGGAEADGGGAGDGGRDGGIDDGDGGVDDGGCAIPAPRSWAIPNAGAYPAPFPIRIGSDDASATIYYTTDGTMPSAASASASGTTSDIPFTAGTPVQFYAASGCAIEMPTHDAVYEIAPTRQTETRFMARELSLAGASPVAVVSPGAAITGQGTFQYWTRTGAPGNIIQVVYGVESTPMGCAASSVPGVWPGVTTTAMLSLTAPSAPGTYFVYGFATGQFGCDAAAFAEYTANAVAGGQQLGVIVVR